MNPWPPFILQIVALMGLLIIALVYDGSFLYIFAGAAGGVLGFNISHLWRNSLPEKR
jgi:hypothetical protein